MTLRLALDGGGLSELKSTGALRREDVQILSHKKFFSSRCVKVVQNEKAKNKTKQKKTEP